MPDSAPVVSLGESAAARPAEAPWRAGVAAARANALPGAVLSVFAVGLLLSYWYVAPVTAALEALAGLKIRWGWPFALVSTALFGGVIPWTVQRVRAGTRSVTPWSHLWFLAGFWGIKGVEVDLLYQLQARVFGDDAEVGTLVVKVLMDQGVYCPLWAVPSTVVAYGFKDAGFSVGRMLRPWRALGFRRWYGRVVLPVLISSVAVWVPAVAVIYCLPLALQLPTQNLVLCFWSLLLAFQVHRAAAGD